MDNYIVEKVTHYCNLSSVKCAEIISTKIDFYDLTFVTSGTMVYIADGTRYTLKKNDAIFLQPGTLREREKNDSNCGYVSFNFYVRPGFKLPFNHYLHNCMSSEIKKIISAFAQSHLHKYYHSTEKLTNMLNYILFDLLDAVSIESSNDHIIGMIKYINSNLTKKITLSSVSENAGLSKEYVAYLFQKEMKKTVVDYINERKMIFAKELIETGELSLIGVSEQLGYDNYNYFSKVFKKYYDLTPMKYKKTRLL